MERYINHFRIRIRSYLLLDKTYRPLGAVKRTTKENYASEKYYIWRIS